MVNRCLLAFLFWCFLFSTAYCDKSPLTYAATPAEKNAEYNLKRADTAYHAAKYNLALEYTSQALDVFRSSGNSKRELYCLTRLGDICRAAEIRPKSLSFLREAIHFAKKTGDPEGLALAYNNYASSWYENGIQYLDSVTKYAGLSMELALPQNLQMIIYSNLNILGMVEFSREDYPNALKFLEQAYPVMMKVNPEDEPLLLVNMARVNFRLGKTAQAEKLGLKAYTMAKSRHTMQYIIISSQFLDRFYNKTNRPQLAYKYLKEGYDSLIEFRVQTYDMMMDEMKGKLKVAETEKENEYLKIRQEYLQQKMNLRLWLILLSGILFMAALLFIITLIYQMRKLKSVNFELNSLNREVADQRDRIKTTAYELGKSNATLEKFIYIIAHDLKNPIATIMGFTKLLIKDQKDLKPEERLKMVEYTNKAAVGASRLLDQLLEWARIHTGSTRAEPKKIPLFEIYLEAVSVVYPSTVLKQLVIQFDIPETLTVLADRNMVLTVFRNLITNAVKFTPNGGWIKISASDAESSKSFVKIMITDSGIGIPGDQIDHLFDIDHQYKRKGTAGETGTGLGLLLCKEYVEKNNGTIRINSEPGEGTTVTFTLPAG